MYGGQTYLITSIADRKMTNVSAGSAKGCGHQIKTGLLRGRYESMSWVMAMLQANMARYAKIVVVADRTGHKVGLVKDWTC